jgi:hypothetical protein
VLAWNEDDAGGCVATGAVGAMDRWSEGADHVVDVVFGEYGRR